MLLVFFVSVFLYNILAIYVTFLGSSIWHAILENYRPGAVWVVDLALYYVFSHRTVGEVWTKWSWMELAGMITMLLGTAIYHGSICLPGFDYSGIENEALQTYGADSRASSPLVKKGFSRGSRVPNYSPIAFTSDSLVSNSPEDGMYSSSSSHSFREQVTIGHGGSTWIGFPACFPFPEPFPASSTTAAEWFVIAFTVDKQRRARSCQLHQRKPFAQPQFRTQSWQQQ